MAKIRKENIIRPRNRSPETKELTGRTVELADQRQAVTTATIQTDKLKIIEYSKGISKYLDVIIKY